jgi:preprotein translocase subunit SecG
MHYFFGITLFLISIFLILLILVQRGRGGGLAGALGGPGGQSAFGTKAGDRFTWVTYGAAVVWIFLAMASIKLIAERQDDFGNIQGGVPAVESRPTPSPARGHTPGAGTTPATNQAEKE